MKGYVFSYGVDGFGQDVAPAFEEGCFLNYEAAFEHFKKLTEKCLKANEDVCFYEEGYAEDEYPKEDWELAEAEKNRNWKLFEKLMEKHILTDVNDICESIIAGEEPPYGFYKMETIEVF